MKLQKYKNGFIFKERGEIIYRTESGKTERRYGSIKELVEGENGKPSQKDQAHEGSATIEVVAETPDES